jgi:hypothetical protein
MKICTSVRGLILTTVWFALLSGCATKSDSSDVEVALAKVSSAGTADDVREKTGEAAEKKHSAMKRRMTCDNIGTVVICTDGKSVCWWGPKNGYGCAF